MLRFWQILLAKCFCCSRSPYKGRNQKIIAAHPSNIDATCWPQKVKNKKNGNYVNFKFSECNYELVGLSP